MTPDKKTAIVTGGARGIGLGIARALAQDGFDLVIAGMRPAEQVAEPVAALTALGHRVHYVQADISQAEDRARLIESTRAVFGRLDLLVNNAGVAPEVRADILDASEESFDRLLRINLKGPYFLTQLAAKWMIEQRKTGVASRGCIINISSISATVASVNRGDYCISKAGIAMASQLWAARLAEHGIDVYEIRPGIVATDMTAGVTEKYDRLIEAGLTLEKRWGTPDDVGRAVATLASGEIPYATGQVLIIDGGLTRPRL